MPFPIRKEVLDELARLLAYDIPENYKGVQKFSKQKEKDPKNEFLE